VRRPLWAAVLVALAVLCPAAVASADLGGVTATASSDVVVKRGDRGPAVRSIQRALGIPADGVFGPQTERAVRRFQRRKGLVADGMVGPVTRSALGLAPFSGSSVSRRGVRLAGVLQRIAECESGGNPRAVSPGGDYRGKYQFTRETWRRLGATGDPADAPEWLQDRMALKLYRQSGTSPWPSCG
jgi:peptidoglycan hydrolase-like protein with peptidoglycan-binding domain